MSTSEALITKIIKEHLFKKAFQSRFMPFRSNLFDFVESEAGGQILNRLSWNVLSRFTVFRLFQ